MVTLGHLRPEMHALAALPGTERLARLSANRWIGYTRANQVLALLEGMLDSEPGKTRPRNLLIVGPSNNGKTTIAERFLRDHIPHTSDSGDREIVPVLAVQMPASPTLIRFHELILAALNSPVSARGRMPHLETLSLRLLASVGCRMLIIDELHNLLAATAQRQRGLCCKISPDQYRWYRPGQIKAQHLVVGQNFATEPSTFIPRAAPMRAKL